MIHLRVASPPEVTGVLIVLENVDTSISALADRATARRGRFHEFTPAWGEVESRITLEGTFPPSWFVLLVIAGLPGQRAIWRRAGRRAALSELQKTGG